MMSAGESPQWHVRDVGACCDVLAGRIDRVLALVPATAPAEAVEMLREAAASLRELAAALRALASVVEPAPKA